VTKSVENKKWMRELSKAFTLQSMTTEVRANVLNFQIFPVNKPLSVPHLLTVMKKSSSKQIDNRKKIFTFTVFAQTSRLSWYQKTAKIFTLTGSGHPYSKSP